MSHPIQRHTMATGNPSYHCYDGQNPNVGMIEHGVSGDYP